MIVYEFGRKSKGISGNRKKTSFAFHCINYNYYLQRKLYKTLAKIALAHKLEKNNVYNKENMKAMTL